jgi:predicted MPP superfamily phosphohydrolase
LWLYVNRGIGLEGHPPKARFFARPEITVIDVVPAVNQALEQPQRLQ